MEFHHVAIPCDAHHTIPDSLAVSGQSCLAAISQKTTTRNIRRLLGVSSKH